jgi:hydroxymethylpyrimidine kinase/phosphomethylpyrimidine kinase
MTVTLTIAGSDSGGGAGIQADLKTFQAFRCYGTSVITAVTAQNTTGVFGVQAVDSDLVEKQIKAVLEDFPVKAAKTGMLFSADLIRSVKNLWLTEYQRNIPLIVDPVMVSTSGDRLLQEDAVSELKELMKLAYLITPNLPEATVLLNRDLRDLKTMEKAAKDLHKMTGAIVLLKGGHRFLNNGSDSSVSSDSSESEKVTDIYYDGKKIRKLIYARLDTRSTHGTGCTLSAAITAGIALGLEPWKATVKARKYLENAMKSAPGLGQGHGPLNHLAKV